jgi:hypothetical protein
MKERSVILLALVLTLLMAAPAVAVQLDVNGRNYETAEPQTTILDGVTSAPVDVVAHTLGCAVTIDGDRVTLQENQTSLVMTVGSKSALLNGQEKTMLQAPRKAGDIIYVPVRFVYECFGATVDWEAAKKTVTVAYPETRNGMTAEDLMLKTSQKMIDANQYKMTVDADTDMVIGYQQTGKDEEKIPLQVTSHIEGWIQTQPMLAYIKQRIIPQASGNESQPNGLPANMETEMLIDEDGVFMNMPATGWVKMEMEGLDMKALLKQSLSQDPASAMQQMKDLGLSLSFANDQEKDGQKYWVIDAVVGGDLLKSDYFKQFSQLVPGGTDMQKLLANTEADIAYSVWINQQTLYVDYMDIQMKMKLALDIPDQDNAGKMNMDMNMTGSYAISDYGKKFEVPDVSQARDFMEVISPEVE